MSKINPRYLVLSDPDFAQKIYIVVPHDLLDQVVSELMKMGVVEVITSGEKKETYEREIESIARYYELLEKAYSLYNEFVQHIEEDVVIEIKEFIPFEEFKSYLNMLLDKFDKVIGELRDINKVIEDLKQKLDELELLHMLIKSLALSNPNGDTSLLRYNGKEFIVDTFYGSLDQLNLVSSRAIAVIGQAIRDQKAVTSMLFISREYHRVVSMIDNSIKRIEYVDKLGVVSLQNALNIIEEELTRTRESMDKFLNTKRDTVAKYLQDLALLKIILDTEYERIKTIYRATKSRYLSLIIGWIPRSKVENVVNHLKTRYPIEVVVEHDPNPPSDFNNLKPYKPFELITEMNGAPSVNDWDPTPLLTYAFIMFFSLMIGDVGYSIGLILASRYILPIFADDPNSEGFKKLQKILYISGAGGIVTGILSGSFFGDLFGQYIPTNLRIIPTEPGLMIGFSIIIGWIWILASHVLALIKNAVKSRDLFGALTEFSMVMLLILGLFYTLDFLSRRGMKPMYGFVNEELYAFVEQNSLYIQLISYAFVALLIASRIKTMGALGAILWIFDLSGALGDVFSFIRIAGIALGTILLANVFNQIIYSVIAMNIALGIAIAIISHFIVFALSPLGPFVHSLRLCILEIGSKIYEGQNRRVSPLSIKIPPRVVVTRKR
ncbi:MAG: hypothetical protein QXZ16_01220 [Ignisphaera sp.]